MPPQGVDRTTGCRLGVSPDGDGIVAIFYRKKKISHTSIHEVYLLTQDKIKKIRDTSEAEVDKLNASQTFSMLISLKMRILLCKKFSPSSQTMPH